MAPAEAADADNVRCLLFRHTCAQPEKRRAFRLQTCDVPTLVRVADSRWCIKSAFEMAKQAAGLDEYKVRNPGTGTAT